MKHVVNFSGGLCSFWAAHRVIQKFGVSSVTLLFADVLVEDPELYRFLDAAVQVLGVPVTRISEGITPWELFRREGAIANSAHPICSFLLKREPLDRAFMAWESEELLTMAQLQDRGIEALSMLKDRRGGITKNLTLQQLRQRVEAGETFSKHEWGGCGCGGVFGQESGPTGRETGRPDKPKVVERPNPTATVNVSPGIG